MSGYTVMIAPSALRTRILLTHGGDELLRAVLPPPSRGMAASVPTVALWRLATIPKYISPADVQRLLDACPRNAECSERNYAILLLLARLGLRAGDVVALELDDIEWRAGEIRVRGKRPQDRFPPLAAVSLRSTLRRSGDPLGRRGRHEAVSGELAVAPTCGGPAVNRLASGPVIG
jgi:integrase